MTSFGQEIVLTKGIFEQLLLSGAKIATLFVKEESSNGKD
jgi:hypothetical protein